VPRLGSALSWALPTAVAAPHPDGPAPPAPFAPARAPDKRLGPSPPAILALRQSVPAQSRGRGVRHCRHAGDRRHRGLRRARAAYARRGPGHAAGAGSRHTAGPPPQPAKISDSLLPQGWTSLAEAYQPYAVHVAADGTLLGDNGPIQLFGVRVPIRSQVCTYQTGERRDQCILALCEGPHPARGECRSLFNSTPSHLLPRRHVGPRADDYPDVEKRPEENG
jgi:hypothetical protein